MFRTACLAAILGLTSALPTLGDSSDHWAVLVAGSSGYGNYRHQSDVCHAYQILIAKGMNPDQIITMAVDDVASSPENPFPGQLFNKPTPAGTPGVDVYANCKIDYSGYDKVTPDLFTKVLTGDSSAGGKVLGSNSNSRVFINFVDHGGPGIIGFPQGVMPVADLTAALNTMSSNNMYKEFVFYLEACESGSMFPSLPPNAYATTAANADESSWGTYCNPDDMVNGKNIQSCLGDLYSVNWMEDADQAHSGETLLEQFNTVKQLTNKSHVLQFGDMDIDNEPVNNFEGTSDSRRKLATKGPSVAGGQLRSEDAAITSAFTRFLSTGSDIAAEELLTGIRDRRTAKTRFAAIAKGVTWRALPELDAIEHDCHAEVVHAYQAACGGITEHFMAEAKTLAQLCKHTEGDATRIITSIQATCPKK